MGLTGGIVDVGGLYDCLTGIFHGKVDEAILDKYNDIRRAKYYQFIDPVSTENLRRLFATNPETALKDDEFFQQLVKAKDDKAFSRELQLVCYGLRANHRLISWVQKINAIQHDFTKYYSQTQT